VIILQKKWLFCKRSIFCKKWLFCKKVDILQKKRLFCKKWIFCKKSGYFAKNGYFAWKLFIPVFSSFFDSSKFFLNLFAACLIFTEVLELVFYYFSYSRVQLRFEPTLQFATWRRRVIFVRLSDVGYVRQISRIHLGHVTWFMSKLKSNPIQKRVEFLTHIINM